MSVNVHGSENRQPEFDQQPQWRTTLRLPDVSASFSSGVNFASPAIGLEPTVTGNVDFESIFGTASPAGPFTSRVQFNSSFEVIGGDLASGRYRR